MGLAERRAIARFKTEEYPGWQARIEQAARFAVPVEVVWEELAVPAAARDGIKKIIVRNTGEFYSTNGFAFADGVLTLDHQPNTNVDYADERAKDLTQLLEAGL
jgi:hypothetical protein